MYYNQGYDGTRAMILFGEEEGLGADSIYGGKSIWGFYN